MRQYKLFKINQKQIKNIFYNSVIKFDLYNQVKGF